VPSDDGAGGRQSQPGSPGTEGEARRTESSHRRVGHSAPRVLHGPELGAIGAVVGVNEHGSSRGRGLYGVEHDVAQGLRQLSRVAGDPTRPVPYTIRLKFPANYAIPAHSHPTDENVVVVSGALTFGMGDALAKGAATNKTLATAASR